MYDVVALGESLIDFAPEGVNAAGVPLYDGRYIYCRVVYGRVWCIGTCIGPPVCMESGRRLFTWSRYRRERGHNVGA